MDQAQHFGGSASSAGASSRSGDTGAEFREGLDAIERERESTCQRFVNRILLTNYYSL